jgi:KaiC/GvpD/RAD55 family RecA-like ATPase
VGGSTASARGPPTPVAEFRISTGNPGLDAMLDGGVIPRRPYLIVGPAGTGKTTLALQFLCEGVRRGERSLLVTLEEPPNEARLNHRGLVPEFERVEVFDAIPDVMRYERVPFKDISAVRSAMPFGQVPFVIRRTPELTGVEVTITALEQMLRSEVARRGYTRVVIDSLTALQYFCMKGFNEVAGAQTFLRFLSDLQVTTFLTVESPLEDVDTTERILARGEIRLFRWELDGSTVRAVGVEKFRGSSHDVRLHPYRIGPRGLDINLSVTVSRDTRQIIEPAPLVTLATPTAGPVFAGSPLDPLTQEVQDLATIGADLGPIRTELEAAVAAVGAKEVERASTHIARASAMAMDLASAYQKTAPPDAAHRTPAVSEALMRVVARADATRPGVAPTMLPPSPELERQLRAVLAKLPVPAIAPPPPPPPPPLVATAPSVSGVPPRVTVPPPSPPAEHLPAPATVAPPPAVAPAPTQARAALTAAPSEVPPRAEPPAQPQRAPVVAAPPPSKEPPAAAPPTAPTRVERPAPKIVAPASPQSEAVPAGPPPRLPAGPRAKPTSAPVVPPPPAAAPTPSVGVRATSTKPRRPSPPEPPVLPTGFAAPAAPGTAAGATAKAAPEPAGPRRETAPTGRPPSPALSTPPPLPSMTVPPPRAATPPTLPPPTLPTPVPEAVALPAPAPAVPPSPPPSEEPVSSIPTPAPPTTAPVPPPLEAPAPPSATVAVPVEAAVKPKRKRAPRARKAEVRAEAVAPVPVSESLPTAEAPNPPAVSDLSPGKAEVPAAPKPRRRTVRKRKAPPVISASPGPAAPVETPPVEAPPAVPPTEAPTPKEGE